MVAKAKKTRVALIVGVVILVMIVLVALIPAMINRGLGHGMIRGAIENQIDGTADFQRVRVAWFGPQTITGLRIIDSADLEAAVLDVQVQQSLFALAFGPSAIDARVAGVVRGELYEDGTISVQRLAIDRPPTDEPFDMQGVPAVNVNVDGVTAHLHDAAGGNTIIARDLRGEFVYIPGSDLRFDIRGDTESADLRGRLVATGSAPGLFDRNGMLVPEDKPLSLDLSVQSIPMPGVEFQSVLHELTVAATSQNIAQLVTLTTQGNATIQQESPSRFSGEFRIRRPIRSDGTVDFALERIEGELTGEQVPSSLLQPMFNATPIVLRRDLGSTANIDVQLNPDGEGLTFIRAVGPQATVDIAAMFREADQWWVGNRFNVQTDSAHPDLVEGFTGLRIEQPTDLDIQLSSFAIPPVDEQLDARPWALAGATGSVRWNGPVTVLIEGDDPDDAPIRTVLSQGELTIDSAQLGDAMYLTGNLGIDGGQLTLEQTITNLGDEQGRIDPSQAEPVGVVNASNLPVATAAQFMPEQEELLIELLGESITASVQTNLAEEGLQAQISASSQTAQASMTALRLDNALRLVDARMQVTLTPNLAAVALRDAMDDPVQLAQPATVRLTFEPAEFPGTAPFDYDFETVPLRGQLNADNLVLTNAPGVEEPLGVTNLLATISAQLGDQPWYTLVGEAVITRPDLGRNVATLAYDVQAGQRDEVTDLAGDATLSNIAVAEIEGLIGQVPGDFSEWVGEAGSLHVAFARVNGQYDATLTSELDRLRGAFRASLTDGIVRLNSDNASVNLGAGAISNLLTTEDDPEAVQVAQDVPMDLLLQSTMPLAMLQGEPFDPEAVDINARFTGGPMILLSNGEQSTLSNVVMAVRSEAVEDGVDFIVNIDADIAETPVTAQTGVIDIDGRVREMFPATAVGDRNPHLDMDGTVRGAPSSIVDSLLNMQGFFISAVGQEINATLNTRDFSRTSGTIAMNVDAPHGWLRLSGQAEDALLWFAEGSPIEAELQLTPLLRDRLLANLHPLFGDILVLYQPLRAVMSNATIPLDGDVSRLNADIEMTLGEVDFDPQSEVFALLRMAQVTGVRRLDGFVDPISLNIRNGVVSYDRFNVTVDRLVMPYQGQIDLNTGQVNLRTALPLEAVVTSIREIPEEARDLEVPLVTRGTFGDLQTQIDPQFDLARALIDAGVRRGLEEIIPRDRLPFDLRDIFPRR